MIDAAARPTALVVRNQPNGGPGRVGAWLEAAGVRLEVVEAYAGEPLPTRLRHAGLLVLGGGLLPDEDENGAWLPATRELTRQALDARVPMLGICLGGQLLAHVAGGTVRGNHGLPEFGSTPIRLRIPAAGDPLFGGLPATVPAIEHHVDAITALPPGATWLARSEHCPYQAFRVGDRAWGVQFHPEATAESVRRWRPEDVRAAGFDHDDLIARAESDQPASTAAWQAVTERFAALLTG
jgi:GMP synthase (glutamine-hydrolysing)